VVSVGRSRGSSIAVLSAGGRCPASDLGAGGRTWNVHETQSGGAATSVRNPTAYERLIDPTLAAEFRSVRKRTDSLLSWVFGMRFRDRPTRLVRIILAVCCAPLIFVGLMFDWVPARDVGAALCVVAVGLVWESPMNGWYSEFARR
jgi:hypothetical protein